MAWNTIENREESVLGRGILDAAIEGEMTQRQIDSIPMHFVIDFSAEYKLQSLSKKRRVN